MRTMGTPRLGILAPGSGSVLRNRVHAGGRCALGPEKTSQPDAERRTGERRPCPEPTVQARRRDPAEERADVTDRKSTRLNSSHGYISYAVFCLKKKKKYTPHIILH